MNYSNSIKKEKTYIRNLSLILFSFGTAFFPRLITYFGAPAPINFVHFLVIPTTFLVVIFTSKVNNKKQKNIAYSLLIASYILLFATILSGFINDAGFANIFLQYMLMIEPFLMVIMLVSIPLNGKRLALFKKLLIYCFSFNLVLALAQSVLMPIGLYPRKGGTLQDNIAGVFASGSGSAGNYVSCCVSVYFSLYFFNYCKDKPLWLRISVVIAAIYQTYISDSKQVFIGFILGFVLLTIPKLKNPVKFLWYAIPITILIVLLVWGLQNTDIAFLDAYRNWTRRAHIYGPEGEAFLTKTAAFRIIPSHFTSPLNWFVGLGPGHTVTRLGGWMIRKYATLLAPIGVTVHPASQEVFQVVYDGWIAQESTIFFPLFTWAGIWGDLGIIGLFSYLYLCFIIWKKLAVDDFCRFMMLSTAVLGFVLTQMEEPGQMLSIACFLGLRWHEQQERITQKKIV